MKGSSALRSFASAALAGVVLALSIGAGGCGGATELPRQKCREKCSSEYESCSRNAYGSGALHVCGMQADRCTAFCPSH